MLDRARRRALERTGRGAGEERRRGAAIERSATRPCSAAARRCGRPPLTLRAHDPERTLERGYALAETADGEPVTTAAAAVAAGAVRLRFADGRVEAGDRGRD